MTEKTIQNVLFERLHQKCSIIVPNYTPAEWFECDIYAVSKAGYATEYEIKISRSDFKADAHKKARKYSTPDTKGKHERLSLSDSFSPCKFYYVVPENLVDVSEVPSYAGLIYIVNTVMREIKKAPRLHKYAVPTKITDHCKGVFYWRFWNQRLKLNQPIA